MNIQINRENLVELRELKKVVVLRVDVRRGQQAQERWITLISGVTEQGG